MASFTYAPPLRARPYPPGSVRLLPGIFQQRQELNQRYLASLRNENLLRNHYLEAGLYQASLKNSDGGESGDDWHWGWEAPTCNARGQFLGHWLSAASRYYAWAGDQELKARVDTVVDGLARCQARNGGEWVFAIPEKHMTWLAQGAAHGHSLWAPHYVLHKTLMGLYDAYVLTGNAQALEVMARAARWLDRWSGQFTPAQFDDILDTETGGMLEVLADLYGATGEPEHRDLMYRYDRPRLFEPLLAGRDVLTNRHANTTIPEAHGAARAYEVTGDERWRRIAEAYWRCAVTERGYFCTGGQTSGEVWTPPQALAARRGDLNQEHCTVYNMIRLADYLFRWTGEAAYADYVERNLYNGILAQQNPQTGMVAYFLPLRGGARKAWGSPTHDFWCCHGSLLQAHTLAPALTYYAGEPGILVGQYIPSELNCQQQGVAVTLRQRRLDTEEKGGWANPDMAARAHRPNAWLIEIAVRSAAPAAFDLSLRLPWWLAGAPSVSVNGQPVAADSSGASGYHTLRRTWSDDLLQIELPFRVSTCPLPDDPATCAFMEGPVVLAGLCDEERTLEWRPADGDEGSAGLLVADDERHWGNWRCSYRARGQAHGLRFVPLYDVCDEHYTIYFPIALR